MTKDGLSSRITNLDDTVDYGEDEATDGMAETQKELTNSPTLNQLRSSSQMHQMKHQGEQHSPSSILRREPTRNKESRRQSLPKVSEKKTPRATLSSWSMGLKQAHNHLMKPGEEKDLALIQKRSKKCRACEGMFRVYLSRGTYNANNPLGLSLPMLLIRAKKLIGKKQYIEAKELLLGIISKEVKHSDVFYLLGEVQRILGSFQEARKNLLEALRYEVHSYFVYESLGMTYFELGDYANALKLFRKFLEFSESDFIHFYVAKCFIRMENHVDAAVHLSKAIEINPNVETYYLFRGDAYDQMGFSELAVYDYRKVRELNPGILDYYNDKLAAAQRENRKSEVMTLRDMIRKIMI